MSGSLCRWSIVVVLLAGCHEPLPPAPTPEPRLESTTPSSQQAVASGDGCRSSVSELPPSPLFDPADPRLHAPSVVVAHKSARRLMLFAQGQLQGCWPMGLGFTPRGHKQHEGDGRTPEGWYRTSDKPWSDFPGAIAVHYPNRADATRAFGEGQLSGQALGEVLGALDADEVPPQQTPMGGEILIHGGGGERDWTLGCMALADDDLDQLRARLPPGLRTSLLVLP